MAEENAGQGPGPHQPVPFHYGWFWRFLCRLGFHKKARHIYAPCARCGH